MWVVGFGCGDDFFDDRPLPSEPFSLNEFDGFREIWSRSENGGLRSRDFSVT